MDIFKKNDNEKVEKNEKVTRDSGATVTTEEVVAGTAEIAKKTQNTSLFYRTIYILQGNMEYLGEKSLNQIINIFRIYETWMNNNTKAFIYHRFSNN